MVHVGVAGPMDLQLLREELHRKPEGSGYAFPMTSYLIRCLLEQGVEVSAFTTDPKAEQPYELVGPRLRVFVEPMRARARDRALDLFARERRGLETAMRDVKPDVLHAHWTYEFALAALTSGIPNLITVHDWAPAILRHHRDAYRAVRLLMQIQVLRRAPALSAVSPYLASSVTRLYRKDAPVVPNGLWRGRQPLRVLSKVDGALRFGCLNAGVSRRKNVKTVLAGFAVARPQLPSGATLTLAGPGHEAGGGLWRWADDHGLLRGVEFVGPLPHDQTSAFLDSLDVFVHPSLEESFGMVVLEAMARGRVILAGARSGAVPWVLDQGRAGHLVDVSSVSQMAQGMVRVAGDETYRIALADAALARAQEFSLERVAASYRGLYERLG